MLKTASYIVGVAVVYSLLIRLLIPSFPVHKGGVVVITGASTGIGHDAALELDKAGYTVFAGVRRQADLELLKSEGSVRLHPIILDVTSSSDIENVLQTVKSFLSYSGLPLAGLVNNAGICYLGPLEYSDQQKDRRSFDVNVFGLMDITRVFIPLLRQSKGRIVNIGSGAGILAAPLVSVYSATKFAVSAISDSLRRELRPHGVSVSEVNPAYVDTPIKGKMDGFDHLTAEQRELYKLDQFEIRSKKSFLKADTTAVTSEAILDAIDNPSPRARYVVANVDGIPLWIMAKLIWHIPVEVLDFIVSRMR